MPCCPRDCLQPVELRAVEQLPEDLRDLLLHDAGTVVLDDHAEAVLFVLDRLDLDVDVGQDAGLLAGVERVVDGLLHGREQRLARVVEAEQVAVLREELATEISRCFVAISSAVLVSACRFLGFGAASSSAAALPRPGFARAAAASAPPSSSIFEVMKKARPPLPSGRLAATAAAPLKSRPRRPAETPRHYNDREKISSSGAAKAGSATSERSSPDSWTARRTSAPASRTKTSIRSRSGSTIQYSGTP